MRFKTTLIIIILALSAINAGAFWSDILILKWDRKEDVTSYLIKIEMTRPSGQKKIYEYTVGDVISTRIDVERKTDHYIELIPINKGGVKGDVLMRLNFTPYTLKF